MTGRPVAAAYVATVAALAGAGFAHESTAAILLATALAFPSGVAGLVAFYLAYGLLALVPGASPDTSSGSASCTADGVCTTSTTGDVASWFPFATDAIGVFALTAAAIANVLLLSALRRAPSGSAAGGAS
jgi:hypothetical protein